jgi:photosystem II core protein PsbZ
MAIIEFLTLLLVLLSLSLVVTVPVALAIPGQWEISKDNFYKSAKLWTTFIFLITLASAIIKIK